MNDHVGPEVPRLWKIKELLFAKASADYLPPNSRYSQLSRVCKELCDSVCDAAAQANDPQLQSVWTIDEFLEERARRIQSLLWSIPRSFHNVYLTTKQGDKVHPFESGVSEMLIAANKQSNFSPEKVREAYTTIWTSGLARYVVWQPSSIPSYVSEKCLEANKDGVESIAGDYLEADDFVSPVLEWAIVDALVLDRMIELSRSFRFIKIDLRIPQNQAVDGPLIPAPAPTISESHGYTWTSVTAELLAQFIKAIFFLISIGATWWLSEFLAGSEGLAKWILFSGLYVAGAVAYAVKATIPDPRELQRKEATQLLWDMGIAHQRVPYMNIKLLRHLFYKLEERGAAFSPYIYKILDKRSRWDAVNRLPKNDQVQIPPT